MTAARPNLIPRRRHSLGFYFFQGIVRRLSFLRHRWDRLVRNLFPSQWRKTGSCIRCGACCDTPTVDLPRFYFRFPHLIELLIRWHEFWYGFSRHETRIETSQLVFTCDHLQPDRSCDDYRHRPQMCRDYPEIRTWFTKPDFFPSCGFRAVRAGDLELERHLAAFKERNRAILNGLSVKKGEDDLARKRPGNQSTDRG